MVRVDTMVLDNTESAREVYEQNHAMHGCLGKV